MSPFAVRRCWRGLSPLCARHCFHTRRAPPGSASAPVRHHRPWPICSRCWCADRPRGSRRQGSRTWRAPVDTSFSAGSLSSWSRWTEPILPITCALRAASSAAGSSPSACSKKTRARSNNFCRTAMSPRLFAIEARVRADRRSPPVDKDLFIRGRSLEQSAGHEKFLRLLEKRSIAGSRYQLATCT